MCALAVQSSVDGYSVKSTCMESCSSSDRSCLSSLRARRDEYCSACIAPMHPCGMH